jgi:hypothetical protein
MPCRLGNAHQLYDPRIGARSLQNQCGRVTHGSVGSTPAPLRRAQIVWPQRIRARLGSPNCRRARRTEAAGDLLKPPRTGARPARASRPPRHGEGMARTRSDTTRCASFASLPYRVATASPWRVPELPSRRRAARGGGPVAPAPTRSPPSGLRRGRSCRSSASRCSNSSGATDLQACLDAPAAPWSATST